MQPEFLIQFVDDRAGHERRYSLDFEKLSALDCRTRADVDTMPEKSSCSGYLMSPQ